MGLKFLLEKKKINIRTFIFNRQSKAWGLLGDLKEFTELVPKKPNIQIERPLIFIIEQEKLVGPFTTAHIIQKIRERVLGPYDILLVEGQKEPFYVRDIKRLFDEFGLPPQKSDAFEGLDTILTKKEFDVMMEKVYRENPELLKRKGREERMNEIKKEEEVDISFIHGEHFEIANDPIWILPAEVTGKPGEPEPMRYLDVLKLVQDGKISKKDPIKKVWDKQWSKLQDIYEFNATTIRKIVDVGGLKVEKIFVQRQYARAAYFAPVQMKAPGKDLRGTCTSISVGGCFVESSVANVQVKEVMSLKFVAGAIPLEFEVNAEVVCVLPKRPQGIGFKFVGLDPKVVDEIKSFVERYAKKMKPN